MVELLQRSKVIIAALTLDAIMAEDLSNPMDELIPTGDPEDWHEAIIHAVLFSAIRPFGEQVDGLVGQIRQKAEEIGYGQKENGNE